MTQIYFEDSLPTGQPFIQTQIVRKVFQSFHLLLKQADLGYPGLGRLVGPEGIGKTIAISAFVASQINEGIGGLPPIIRIKFSGKPTARSATKTIATELGELISAGLVNEQRIATISEKLTANYVRLLIVDGADHATLDSLELVRGVHVNSGVPIVAVGSKDLVTLSNSLPGFSNRLKVDLELGRLPLSDVLDVILPKLTFPRWHYDPAHPADRALGRLIYRLSRGSFRSICTLLLNAAIGAESRGLDTIDLSCINASANVGLGWVSRTPLDLNDSQTNSAEAESERRLKAKENKKLGSQDQP